MSQARTVTAEFRTVHVLTVTKSGNGFGSVATTSPSTGINCGADCTETYDVGTMVSLTATAASTPLSQDSSFAGWTGGACSGTGTCTVTLAAATTVNAVFILKPNYAFVTSTLHTGNLGGLSGADAICQARANAASLPGTFRAWLSSDSTTAAARLGTASGWIRPDGRPWALSQTDLFAGRERYPLRLTETGADVGSQYVWSASLMDGSRNPIGTTCTNWTSASSSLTSRAGSTSALGDIWAEAYAGMTCSSQLQLSCFGIDRVAPMGPLPLNVARRVFMSTYGWNPSSGIAAADALCNSDASANGLPGTYRAFLATTTASAASRFSNGVFIRVDNAVVAVDTLFTAAFWDTAINVFANGSHSGNAGVYTGATSPTAVGTSTSTCNNWSSTSGFAEAGRPYDSDVNRAFTSLNAQCDGNGAVYCVQL
jgi:hypothetical protein